MTFLRPEGSGVLAPTQSGKRLDLGVCWMTRYAILFASQKRRLAAESAPSSTAHTRG